ncbi:MAG: methylcrotonoyl-CoA carboxylase [Novosphingobium sp. 28-62-57]|uniref:acetyl/propionyl/methylcrotonyl-CoA carboxylase subunit alpha n=1 Tax=unclassified Novosphingobium TaxID=2644732 RepID=UPI000BD0B81B|nr:MULTISPECIES: acetyl/propionyl/methylcrotonyl-CoA carboxylase subunit alpha [unclassified Novosphingobium]OYW49985.1 MAG: methylcrotonoyl-CoA carboxylase [Novosphingobium sp. 12-62-10]OYZ12139.1 MAG: methylcrotonoyl-CoA carboxylase [Novosphingobium sp. 28-62-57]OZA34848.1 MAG: methylcrotonoyl-CoA carboxylase [Novosphingobium sp. 17-62-9]
MIQSLLIANRGEIACRVIRTARNMGIRTVAVYSDADRNSLHVRSADEAVHIGPSPARESYLCGDRIIGAAKATGAEAIHPGYGFLSENAEFAQAVIDAGLVWVGPKPASITAMGLKDAAKARMIAAGVPVTPGYLGEDQSPERLQAEADAIGYPVLIKAVAGGGGKGMRRVEASADFAEALASCRREAASSFGDDRVLIEKYILSPRHIEVQVFGDSHGNVVHLFERDCSLQRRHQKVIEEAPAPGMDEAMREAVCSAAVRAAKAVDYEGAGTIEFIADGSEGLRADRIWFMEMNTRLQVEHPVTEMITGIDLVQWQLRVASGLPLPRRQEQLSIRGHAIEARLYAEDPTKGSLPSTGKLEYFRLLEKFEPYEYRAVDGSWNWNEQDARLRVDTGFEEGDEVTPFYDPMLAKLIVHAPDRLRAISGLLNATGSVRCWPVKTNASMLHGLLLERDFDKAKLSTAFIEEHPDVVYDDNGPSRASLTHAAELFVSPDIPHDLTGFRLNADHNGKVLLSVDGQPKTGHLFFALHEDHGRYFPAERVGNAIFSSSLGRTHRITISEVRGAGLANMGDGAILSPMPGKVISVDVAAGQAVTKGQKLLVLEAMKMEHALTAPFDGVVAELNAVAGAQVQVEALLVRVEKVD